MAVGAGQAGHQGGDKDRRGTERKPIVRNAVITFGGEPIVCSVRNISAQGARLIMTGTAGVPERFRLTLTADGMVYTANVKRRSPTELGVTFEGTPVAVAPRTEHPLRHFDTLADRR